MEGLLEKGQGPRIELVAVVGLENSPSYEVERTIRTVDGVNIISPGRGHLMETLELEMRRKDIDAPFIGLSLTGPEREERLKRLEDLCTWT